MAFLWWDFRKRCIQTTDEVIEEIKAMHPGATDGEVKALFDMDINVGNLGEAVKIKKGSIERRPTPL